MQNIPKEWFENFSVKIWTPLYSVMEWNFVFKQENCPMSDNLGSMASCRRGNVKISTAGLSLFLVGAAKRSSSIEPLYMWK